jgi:glycosyltransferase involved in cell wall biosynthesis
MPKRPSLLLLSQGYPPDPVAIGQYLHAAAREMVRRGWDVRVVTSARGWGDPGRRYPPSDRLDGVDVHRISGGSMGRTGLWSRVAGGLGFLAHALPAALRGPAPDHLLVSTCPPMAPVVGALVARLRRVPMTFWVMDLNPDQAIASGVVGPRTLSARLLEWGNRTAARCSRRVVVLDHFMAERIAGRWVPAGDPRLATVPPWPLEDHVAPVAPAENPFRARHGLTGKRVVMYSGNLSPVHPLDTILQAARELQNDPSLRFLFVGEGGQKGQIEEAVRRDGLNNVRLLPYQPMEDLRYSLSAGDVHLVSMGATMVGIVHPSKVYGAMAAARAVLYLGPKRSHVGEMVERFEIGWQVEHGDVAGAVSALREIATMPEASLRGRGERARQALGDELSQSRLLGDFCDLVESGVVSGAPR